MDNPEKGINDKATAFTHNVKLVNDARKKCLAATDGFQFLTNQGTFTRRSGINSTNKDYAIIANTFKYPNYLKASSKLAERNNLCAVKGPIHHKRKLQPKIRSSSNDLIDSHGEALEMQAEKKHKDKTNENIYNGSKNSVSSKILSKYPNYLKASSKLKERNYSHLTTSNSRVKSQLQNKDRKFVHDNANLHIRNKNLELQTLIDENEKFKNKLTNIMESLQEIIFQCKEEDGEVKLSKYHTTCQKQEIKSQKSTFKFPQMDESNKLKNVDILKTPLKKLNQRTNHQSLGCQMTVFNSDLNRSVFKSDLEKKKNPTQYLIELKKQNKLIIRNLNELQENLKRMHKLQISKLDLTNTKKQQPLKTKRKKMNDFSKSLEPPAVIPEQIKATVPPKEQPEMLREMIQFNKMMKDKRSCFQDHETINRVRKTPANDETTSISNSLSKETKLKSKQDFSSISSTINYTKTSEIQRQNIKTQNNSQECLSVTTKVRKIHSHRLPRYNVDEKKDLAFTNNKEDKIQCVLSTVAQRDISQNKLSFKTKSNGRKVHPEYDSFSTASTSNDAKSCGDNAMVYLKHPKL